jgi:L-ascorbate oxidase
MLLTIPALLMLCISSAVGDSLHHHDGTFTPDHVLRITREPYRIGCDAIRETYLVNGTTPGPLLHLKTGRISWIRVYNDVPDTNLTMVSPPKVCFIPIMQYHI